MGSYVCEDCYEQINFLLLPVKISLEPCYLQSITAATSFTSPISQLIHEFKYKNVRGMGKWAADFLFTTTQIPLTTIVTAVPLHSRRQAKRGFNQAEEIAQELALLLHVPYQPLLDRQRPTLSQASQAHRHQRLTQLHDCFAMNSKAPLPAHAENVSVLLIDDVVTTGSTLNECAQVLKQNGYGSIHALVLAHGQ